MVERYAFTLARTLTKERLVRRGSMQGCSPVEIASVAASQGASLPAEYESLLAVMGRQVGRVFEGTDCLYPRVLDLRGWADELLADDGWPMRLPSDAVVFSMHQGYQFLFILSSEGDDPPVYRYQEGDGRPTKEFGSFSAYLAQVLQECREDRWLL